MKHLFVPYDLALKLKEKGFDEDCFGFYNCISMSTHGEHTLKYFKENHLYRNSMFHPAQVCAPLYQSELTIFEQHPETNITCYKNSEVRQEGNVLAPLNQQAIEWFAKEFKIYISIDAIREDYFMFSLWSFTGKKNVHDDGESFENYNDCLTKAIEEALKLI